MSEKIKVKITIPRGMKPKVFDRWLADLQVMVENMTAGESTATEELLELAEMAKLNNGGSFNWNIRQQLEKSNLPENCRHVVTEFMRYGYLPVLHEIIQERKLRQVITDDVNDVESLFQSKGWKIDGDFWKKKVWLNSEQYRLTLVGRGMEISRMAYVKATAIFNKSGDLVQEESKQFSPYLRELV